MLIPLDSNNTAIISVQTEFMRQTLSIFSNTIQLSNTETTVECDHNFDLNNDDIVIEAPFPKVFKYGCIMDAAHKFFANGQLLVTCCYFDILHRWQPILLSWIGRQTTETYASHFFTLFNSIAYGFKVKNEEYFTLATFQQVLGTVVDFSELQQTGFQMA